MVTLPFFLPVTRPSALTVAIFALLLFHVTACLASAGKHFAVNCKVGSSLFKSMIDKPVSDTTVTFDTAGITVIVKSTDSLFPFLYVAVIVTSESFFTFLAVTIPAEETVATDLLLLFHVISLDLATASLYFAVSVTFLPATRISAPLMIKGLGSGVGSSVGATVGSSVGATVGSSVGATVGSSVGATLGSSVGAEVGSDVIPLTDSTITSSTETVASGSKSSESYSTSVVNNAAFSSRDTSSVSATAKETLVSNIPNINNIAMILRTIIPPQYIKLHFPTRLLYSKQIILSSIDLFFCATV